MFNFKKKIIVTTTRETEPLISAIDVWTVKWERMMSKYDVNPRPTYQAFTSYEEAQKFKSSLEQAFKLLRQQAYTEVSLYKEEDGLE